MKYFRDPTALIKAKEEEMKDKEEGNALIDKLKRQSEENKEKNDLYVQRKTFENDQVCVFVSVLVCLSSSSSST